ncbi:hypothetical protein QQS21_003192 [Conoideocrella luteorostrata]|uniref:BRCT domain-containing protein n=1 Tax=Conoideocrella luteorostrata TaxID=1105319 RepID=A0AAJ0CWQ9_9HYPO|nr:hypothetical protein QQS21_003192 [Conoideocrella luteorostrata]
MDSPPKRMTRARAAAKASESALKTTRIVTAAAKARTTSRATASTKSTAAKRKTRADEKDDEGDDELADARAVSTIRARLRAESEGSNAAVTDEPFTNSSQNRAAGVATVKAPAEDYSRSTRIRGRPKKTTGDELPAATQEPSKRITRITGNRSITAKKKSLDEPKPIMRKTVKFQQSGKENMSLASKANGVATINAQRGFRGRPARRGTTATPNVSSNSTASASESILKKPLSPKKVTQMPICRDRESSDDELAGGNEIMPTMKSLSKLPKNASCNHMASKTNSAKIEADYNTDATKFPTDTGAVALGSPPRRPPTSPQKDSFKSPAKRLYGVKLPGSDMKPIFVPSADQEAQTSVRMNTLLQSPAKRPSSPIKDFSFPTLITRSTLHSQPAAKGCSMLQSPAKRAMPGAKPSSQLLPDDEDPLTVTPQMQPIVASASSVNMSGRPSDLLLAEELGDAGHDMMAHEPFTGPIETPRFPGRLSAVLPRQADPLLIEQSSEKGTEDIKLDLIGNLSMANVILSKERDQVEANDLPAYEHTSIQASITSQGVEQQRSMVLEEEPAEVEDENEVLEPQSPMTESDMAIAHSQRISAFQLRENALDPSSNDGFDIGSGDDSSPLKQLSTSSDGLNLRTNDNRDSPFALGRQSRRCTMGLTSLTEQLDVWSAAGLAKEAPHGSALVLDIKNTKSTPPASNTVVSLESESFQMKNLFFDDEILAHTGTVSSGEEIGSQAGQDDDDDGIVMEDINMLDEDIALVEEADNMSVVLQEQSHDVADARLMEETLSEASQEYGDENELPIDPVLSSGKVAAPVTPPQLLRQKSFFTTTKVPLKPADDSESSPLKQRSFSTSRISSRNIGSLPRSATVISYSPAKEKQRASILTGEEFFSTPSKEDIWSNVGTPGRTPRRDVNPGLLHGAVIFVDVHTTEGADASSIFIELLNHMGAKCVRSWHWNPSGAGNGDGPSKVGITHVVFKDGGKRTMEKVRETNGVVHCVGVSWVLDCERENEWLDEAPYYIDTALVPRGGARRRKSMEPRAIANKNGTIVSSINKTSRSPTTPRSRRESTLWMFTPSEQGDHGDDDGDLEWSCALLTPVPKTPAPEAVAKYASELPDTPLSERPSDIISPTKHGFLTRTCPSKGGKYCELGDGILRHDKDEQVMLRLMAARRKSLQFAPKIGSPLARNWN